MSSHREAPQISKDPTADSTDVYAFVSPDAPSTVTLIANYIPLQAPDGGPNFYEFADDVQYAINIDNDGDGNVDIAYLFTFKTVNNTPTSFLYNDGPITPFGPPKAGSNWNRQQTYTLTKVTHSRPKHGKHTSVHRTLGTNMLVPPCNVGPLSTPNYAKTYLSGSGHSAIQRFSSGGGTGKVFAGQRAEGFYVDLGAVFDLGGLRGFENYHVGGPAAGLMAGMPGVNSTAAVNVHSLALQIPIKDVVRGNAPTSTTASNAVIGVWTSASRRKARLADSDGSYKETGPYTQVSRLGNPLVNELLIGIADKDKWNVESPNSDGTTFFPFFANPLLGDLLPALYTADGTPSGQTIFPNLAAYNKSHTGTTKKNPARPDLVAILLTGIPDAVTKALGAPPTNVGGTGVADHLRLNVAQPPTDSSKVSNLGYLGGDPAGFPNGRRVFDDVATIELRAVAGATIPLVDPSYKPDAPAGEVDFSLTSSASDTTAKGTESYLDSFPYLGTPWSGYGTPGTTPTSKSTGA